MPGRNCSNACRSLSKTTASSADNKETSISISSHSCICSGGKRGSRKAAAAAFALTSASKARCACRLPMQRRNCRPRLRVTNVAPCSCSQRCCSSAPRAGWLCDRQRVLHRLLRRSGRNRYTPHAAQSSPWGTPDRRRPLRCRETPDGGRQLLTVSGVKGTSNSRISNVLHVRAMLAYLMLAYLMLACALLPFAVDDNALNMRQSKPPFRQHGDGA